jgi:hypothetical protein
MMLAKAVIEFQTPARVPCSRGLYHCDVYRIMETPMVDSKKPRKLDMLARAGNGT